MTIETSFNNLNLETLATNEELLREYLYELYPEMDTSPGTVIDELLIRPAAVLYTAQEDDLNKLREQYSLNLLSNSSDPDTEMIENLASNFRLYRKEGTRGAGVLTAYSNTSNNIYIPLDSLFSCGGVEVVTTKTYIAVLDTDGTIDSSSIEYRKMIKSGDYYVFTFPVITVDPTARTADVNTKATPVNQFSNISSFVVSSAVTGGTDDEADFSLLSRAQTGIAAKIPSGKTHIRSILEESGITVITSDVFGLGDEEMLRDSNNVFGMSTGGRVDVFLKTSQIPSTTSLIKTCTKNGNVWSCNIDRFDAPGFYYVSTVEHQNNTNNITDPASITVTYRPSTSAGDPEIPTAISGRYSVFQAATVEFEYEGIPGTTSDFIISVVGLPNLKVLQDYVDQEEIRSQTQDIVVKGGVPCFVGVGLSIRVVEDLTTDLEDSIRTIICNTINNLSIGRGYITAGDLESAIRSVHTSVNIEFPISLSTTTYMPDGSIVSDQTKSGEIHAHEDSEQGVTERNTVFYCLSKDVSVTLINI